MELCILQTTRRLGARIKEDKEFDFIAHNVLSDHIIFSLIIFNYRLLHEKIKLQIK